MLVVLSLSAPLMPGLDAEVVALGKELIDKRPSSGHAWGVGGDSDSDPSLARTTLLSLQVHCSSLYQPRAVRWWGPLGGCVGVLCDC